MKFYCFALWFLHVLLNCLQNITRLGCFLRWFSLPISSLQRIIIIITITIITAIFIVVNKCTKLRRKQRKTSELMSMVGSKANTIVRVKIKTRLQKKQKKQEEELEEECLSHRLIDFSVMSSHICKAMFSSLTTSKCTALETAT